MGGVARALVSRGRGMVRGAAVLVEVVVVVSAGGDDSRRVAVSGWLCVRDRGPRTSVCLV